MKSLCIIAIGTLIAMAPAESFAQDWKDKLGVSKKGKVYAKDLNEDQTMELLGGYKPDDGVISDFHAAHQNQVVFTSKEMDPKDITEADVKTSFGINEPIYFTFFMPKSLRNQVIYPLDKNGINETYYYDNSFHKWYHGPEYNSSNSNTGIPKINGYGSNLIYLEIDGVQIADIIFFVKVDFNSTKTAFTGYISPDPTKTQPRTEWIKHMTDLSAGDHKVKMEIAGYEKSSESNIHMTKGLIATGEFTLKKGAGENFTPKMGKSWADYTSKMNDATLEAKILKAVQDYGRVNGYSEKFVAIKIASSDWTITRTKTLTPVITGRYLVAYCRSKWENGQCKVQRYSFRQEYDGSKYSSVVISRGVYNNDYPQAIDCD